MPATFTYQVLGCVIVVPHYVPEIVANSKIRETVGSRHTQLLDTPDAELIVYGTLQIANVKQPPQQASLSVTQVGNEPTSRLVPVAQVAFSLALKDQSAMAVGINFNATVTLSEQGAGTLLHGLLNPKIVERRTNRGGTLTGGGIRLIYDKSPWVATVAIESDPTNETQAVCSVNFNINNPTKGEVTLIQQVDKLRAWFEQTVKEIVEESNA